MELMQANRQWSSRPADERFVSLFDMQDHFDLVRSQSRGVVVPSSKISAQPVTIDGNLDHKAIEIVGPNGHAYSPTHWAFGQLATLADAPAGYLRTLPSPVAADCINYGLIAKRQVEDVGVLLQRNGANIMRAATGPRYGRIWNADIVSKLTSEFGDGITGDWRVPGEFGKHVTITKENTTLFASDRDMFVFLADEDHRIEVPNRRNGESGALARGFFVWNSEVGAKTFGLGTFLFDYVCCNRIVWGAQEYREITIRHTVSAPDRFLEEIHPALQSYATSSSANVTKAIEDARNKRLGDKLDDFLANRFGKRMVPVLNKVHELEEGRPIETLWDVTNAVTAYAKGIKHTDERVEWERQGGAILDLAAN